MLRLLLLGGERMKLYRNFDTLSRREKIAAGIFTTALGCLFVVAAELSLGFALEYSIRNLVLTITVGILASLLYAIYTRAKRSKGGKELS